MSEQLPKQRGRPPENRHHRQTAIFEAVIPLLRTRGARRLTMREAARAACISLGGLHHYFPTKPALLFWPLSPATCRAASEDFERQCVALRRDDPPAYFREFVASTVDAIVTYCTPSMQAAIELDANVFWNVMRTGMTPGPLVALFEEVHAPLTPLERDALTRGVRRAFFGATLDPRVTYEELLDDVWRQLSAVRGDAREPIAAVSSDGARGSGTSGGSAAGGGPPRLFA